MHNVILILRKVVPFDQSHRRHLLDSKSQYEKRLLILIVSCHKHSSNKTITISYMLCKKLYLHSMTFYIFLASTKNLKRTTQKMIGAAQEHTPLTANKATYFRLRRHHFVVSSSTSNGITSSPLFLLSSLLCLFG